MRFRCSFNSGDAICVGALMYGGLPMVMSKPPPFEGGYKDVWQLFGHVHTRKNNTGLDAARLQYLYPTQYDVGVDNNNFTPVSFEQVKRIITKQIEKGGR